MHSLNKTSIGETPRVKVSVIDMIYIWKIYQIFMILNGKFIAWQPLHSMQYGYTVIRKSREIQSWNLISYNFRLELQRISIL